MIYNCLVIDIRIIKEVFAPFFYLESLLDSGGNVSLVTESHIPVRDSGNWLLFVELLREDAFTNLTNSLSTTTQICP